MAKKASTLCSYAIKQIGKPYWYGTAGQTASSKLYKYMKKHHPKYYKASDFTKQYGKKVHDCSGLIVAALGSSVKHGATSQYNQCSTKSPDKKNFPGIPGTLVFVNENKSGSKKSHVGVYIGNLTTASGKKYTDAVVEAKGHKWGVVVSKWSDAKWDSWGQLKSSLCNYNTKKGQAFIANPAAAAAAAGAAAGAKAVQTVQVNPRSFIKLDQISQYIATLGPTIKTADFSFLKKNDVVAIMLYGGALYDVSHREKTYMNPNLPALAKGCIDANLPFAMYVDVKAHNEIEADAECRALYYVVSAYPPKFGVWLYINTQRDQSMNDKIINIYYKYLQKWGLTDRCGIYMEISRLSTISWSSFQDKFYLWGIDKTLDLKKVENKLLEPSMFEVK